MTWATPGMVSSRGRITQSTTSRTSMGLAASPATAISMISPMIEVIGAICGLTLRGSCSRTTLKPLGDLLPVEVDVGAPVELDVDDRQADARHRAHAHDARHAVHRRLERERDELLDLLGGQALGLGHRA